MVWAFAVADSSINVAAIHPKLTILMRRTSIFCR